MEQIRNRCVDTCDSAFGKLRGDAVPVEPDGFSLYLLSTRHVTILRQLLSITSSQG